MVSCEFSTRLFQHWPSLGRGWPRPRPADRLVLAQKCPAIDAGSAELVVNYLAPSHFASMQTDENRWDEKVDPRSRMALS